MTVVRTILSKSRRGQVIRLPKAVALPESVHEVDIVAVGTQRLILPAGGAWDSWFDGPRVTEDFMACREQHKEQRRRSL